MKLKGHLGLILVTALVLGLLTAFTISSTVLAAKKTRTYNDSFARSIIVSADVDKVWELVGDPVALPSWIPGIGKTIYLSKSKKGEGTVRKITMEDGTVIEEHIVDWEPEDHHYSYIMVKGFPFRGYYATMSIEPLSNKSSLFTWSVYYTTEPMTKKKFEGFQSTLRGLFEGTCQNLKSILEK